MLDLRGDLAPLPSVPLGFLDKLAGYAVCLVLRVDEVVESSVAAGLLMFDHVKCGVRNGREDAVRVLQFVVLAVRERQKIELHHLLRRCPPQQRNVAPTTLTGQICESVPQFLPRINSRVSLWSFL
jgi:hypothetical protein